MEATSSSVALITAMGEGRRHPSLRCGQTAERALSVSAGQFEEVPRDGTKGANSNVSCVIYLYLYFNC